MTLYMLRKPTDPADELISFVRNQIHEYESKIAGETLNTGARKFTEENGCVLVVNFPDSGACN
jgi:hypothetical protein